MKPPVSAAEIKQRIAMRLELRAHDAADQNEMVTSLVQRFTLAFERDEGASEQGNARLPRRPRQVREAILALRCEAIRRRLLPDLKDIDPEMRRIAEDRRSP